MKIIINAFILFLISLRGFAAPVLNSESGPGNGTDYVKVLFANARQEASELLSSITEDTIKHLEVEDYFKEWLMAEVEGSPRYIKLKFYADNFEFKFQDAPCPDENSICFYKDPTAMVVVSMNENQNTTEKQAVTMLLHEIGHFTGEYDHLFLDRFGAALMATSHHPFVIVKKENKRYVPSVFEAANSCERGEGEQAENLKPKIQMAISEECLKRNLQCNVDDIEYAFEATLPSLGLGFDSTSICKAQGLIKAKR